MRDSGFGLRIQDRGERYAEEAAAERQHDVFGQQHQDGPRSLQSRATCNSATCNVLDVPRAHVHVRRATHVRTSTSARRMVWVSDALTPGPHTLRIVSLDGRVELDAFLVLR